MVQWWTFVHPIVTASVGKTNKIPKPSAESSQRIPPDKFTERSEWTWDSGRVLPKENLGRFVFLGGILWPGLYGLPGRIPGPGKKTRISWRVRKKHHEIKVPWTATFHSVFPPKMWHARADWVLWIVFETCLTGQPPSTESKDTTRICSGWAKHGRPDLEETPDGGKCQTCQNSIRAKTRVINYQ